MESIYIVDLFFVLNDINTDERPLRLPRQGAERWSSGPHTCAASTRSTNEADPIANIELILLVTCAVPRILIGAVPFANQHRDN